MSPRARDGKTYERASNAGVKISSSGRDFTVCWVLLFIDHIIVVSIDVWPVQHCRGIVREAMRMGEGGGNFIRRSNNIKQYAISKAVDTLAKKEPKVPFML